MNVHKNVKDASPVPCPELAELGASWAELLILERVKHLRDHIDKGYSRRELAHAVGCSEALIRQLLKMEELYEKDKQALQKGSLSVRTALQRIKEWENIEEQQQLKKAEQEVAHQAEIIVGAFKNWIESLQLDGVYLKNLFDELQRGLKEHLANRALQERPTPGRAFWV